MRSIYVRDACLPSIVMGIVMARWLRWAGGLTLSFLLAGACAQADQEPGATVEHVQASEGAKPPGDDLPTFASTRRHGLAEHWLPPSWYCRFGKGKPDPLEMAEKQPRWERRAMDIFSWDSFLASNWPYAYEGSSWVPHASMTRESEYLPRWGAWIRGPELPAWMEDAVQGEASPPDGGSSLLRRGAEDWRCEGDCLEGELSGKGTGATGKVLWDQNGENVYYEIRVNDSWLNTVKTAYAQGRNRMSFQYGQCKELYAGDQFTFEGAVEIKLTWKVLGTGDIRDRFYTMSNVEMPDEARRAELGLVGVHITHKSKTQSDWIWSSFEHVDNVRANALGDGARSTPSFNDPSCASCCPNSVPTPGAQPPSTQLTRTEPIDESTEELNREVREWLAAQGSVWQYYELIGTQYRSRASGEITPARLRNTVIEPYLVPKTSCMTRPPPGERSSCIGCHKAADSGDFSFVPEIFLPRLSPSQPH